MDSRLKALGAEGPNNKIDTVLLSGGSANIGWLEIFLKEDFPEILGKAAFTSIPDYQSVVSQGLAVDCALEFSKGVSDFTGVTYNPLYLLLGPDSSHVLPRKFRPEEEKLFIDMYGLLMPSALRVQDLIDKKLSWTVNLEKAPRVCLDYYFLQNSLDKDDPTALQNVEERLIPIPKGIKVDQEVKVSLQIREDGTAQPIFSFSERGKKEVIAKINGRPFYFDFTETKTEASSAYLGIDFGTSNTSVCYVDTRSIKEVEQMATDTRVATLNDAIELVPFMAANPLGNYIGQSKNGLIPPEFTLIEDAMAFISYSAYMARVNVSLDRNTFVMKDFRNRSGGKLMGMLRDILDVSAKESVYVGCLKEALSGGALEMLSKFVDAYVNYRHEKPMDPQFNVRDAVWSLTLLLKRICERFKLGYCENLRRAPFKKKLVGHFRITHGRSPFSELLEITCSQDIPSYEPLLLDVETGDALSLYPLIVWHKCKTHPLDDNGHCFVLDSLSADSNPVFKYKGLGVACPLPMEDLADSDCLEFFRGIRTSDPSEFPNKFKIEIIKDKEE